MHTRLLVLTAAWPSRRFPHVGGFIRNLTHGMREEGFDIHVVAPGPHGGGDGAFGFAVPAVRMKLAAPSLVGGMLYLLSATRTCVRVGRVCGAEALLVHWVLPTGPAARWAARRLGIPLFSWAHGSDLEVYAAHGGITGALARAVVRGSSGMFAVSSSLCRKAREFGAARVTHLPMGVAPVFKEMPQRRRPAGPFTVMFCGDLVPAKGVYELAVARRLMGPGRPARWICAGDGPCKTLLARAGMEMRPRLVAEEVTALMDESHVLVLPSRSEGTPLVILEALCRGLPVIASAVGGIADLVCTGREGVLLSPPVRGRALARALVELYDNPPTREMLGAHARARGAQVRTAREIAASFRHALTAWRSPEGGAPSIL